MCPPSSTINGRSDTTWSLPGHDVSLMPYLIWSEEMINPRFFKSSAAAIAASGLLQLAQITGDPLRARFYHDYALTIVDTLTEPQFLGTEEGYEGILKHGMYHQRKRLGVDESVMWGEYFFLEAVSKVLGYE